MTDAGEAQYTTLGKLYNVVLLLATLCILINIREDLPDFSGNGPLEDQESLLWEPA